MTDTNEFDTQGASEAVCPWCGHIHDCSNEFFGDNEYIADDCCCSSCGKQFDCEVEYSAEYTTRKHIDEVSK